MKIEGGKQPSWFRFLLSHVGLYTGGLGRPEAPRVCPRPPISMKSQGAGGMPWFARQLQESYWYRMRQTLTGQVGCDGCMELLGCFGAVLGSACWEQCGRSTAWTSTASPLDFLPSVLQAVKHKGIIGNVVGKLQAPAGTYCSLAARFMGCSELSAPGLERAAPEGAGLFGGERF